MLYFYLLCLSIQDIRTYTISKRWVLFSFGFLLLVGQKSFVASILFGIPCFIFYRYKKWMGSMDVYFIVLFSYVLGIERMIICMYVAILFGFLWFLFTKNKYCPFLSCLSIGFIVAMEKGYFIYYFLVKIIIG